MFELMILILWANIMVKLFGPEYKIILFEVTLENNNIAKIMFCLEMSLWTPETEEILVFWVGLAAALILLMVNIPLLWIVKKTWKSSLINQLIGFDCVVALLHIPCILISAHIIDTPCWFR